MTCSKKWVHLPVPNIVVDLTRCIVVPEGRERLPRRSRQRPQGVSPPPSLSSLSSLSAPDKVNVTYDVRCICSPSVDTRFDNYSFATLGNRGVSSAVPMFHLNAHREYCRSVVSPHLLLNGVGLIVKVWSVDGHG